MYIKLGGIAFVTVLAKYLGIIKYNLHFQNI